jgi:hypothetical protein
MTPEHEQFIVANHVRSIPPDLEQARAARISTHSIALKTCDVAMLDLPFKVADVIADAAGEERGTYDPDTTEE